MSTFPPLYRSITAGLEAIKIGSTVFTRNCEGRGKWTPVLEDVERIRVAAQDADEAMSQATRKKGDAYAQVRKRAFKLNLILTAYTQGKNAFGPTDWTHMSLEKAIEKEAQKLSEKRRRRRNIQAHDTKLLKQAEKFSNRKS